MKVNQGFISVILAGTLFGTIPIFSAFLRDSNISSLQQVFIRILISLCALLIINLFFKKLNYSGIKVIHFLIHGFLLQMAFFTYLSSIALGTPVAKAILLIYFHPVFGIILSYFFLKENITIKKILVAIIAFIGVLLILEIWNIDLASIDTIAGDIFALVNAFFYASYIVVGRYFRLENKYHFITTTFWSFFFAFVWLIPTWILSSLITNNYALIGFTTEFSSITLINFLGLSIIGTTLPFLLLNLGLEQVEASDSVILLLVELLSVFVLGYLFLDETIKFWQLAGGILIITSSCLIYYKRI